MALRIDIATPVGPAQPLAGRWLGWMCLCTAVAALGYGMAVYARGAAQVQDALVRISASALAFAVAATALSLLLRALRWQAILRAMGHRLPWLLQVRVYLAGLALSSTPGKVGETARSALLHPAVPLAQSLAAFVCDRWADVLAVAALGALGAAVASERQPVLEGLALVGAAGSLAVARWWQQGAWRPRRNWALRLWAPAMAWAGCWTPRRAALYVTAGAAAYGCQAAAFAVFVSQVHQGLPLAACVMIFASSTLIGAASLVPGGLGTMDAALVWQLQAHGVAGDAALAAALAARVTTLWLAWLLGLLAMLSFGRTTRRVR